MPALSHAYSHAYSYGDIYSYPDCKSYSDAYADFKSYGDGDCDANPTTADAHAYHRSRDFNIHPITNAHRHAASLPDIYKHANADYYINIDTDEHRDADIDSNTNTHLDSHPEPDSGDDVHVAVSPDVGVVSVGTLQVKFPGDVRRPLMGIQHLPDSLMCTYG